MGFHGTRLAGLKKNTISHAHTHTHIYEEGGAPRSPSCKRRMKRLFMAVPEMVPICPARETVWASFQLETPMPMPP